MSVCVSVRTVTVEVSLLVHSGSGAPNALEQVTTAVLVKVPARVVSALTVMIFSTPAPTVPRLHSISRSLGNVQTVCVCVCVKEE
jgi:hypothetical protein